MMKTPMMKPWSRTLCAFPLILLLCPLILVLYSGARGEEQTAEENLEVVTRAFANLILEYDARDAKALADLFTPQGEFVDAEGNIFQGRDAISREFTALFEINPYNSLNITTESVREISPGVLSVDSVATIAGSKDPEPDKVDFAAVVVKQADGRWLLASIRSAGEGNLDTPHARLKQLEWLIGDWVDESDESTMHTSTRWSADGQFLLTEFSIRVARKTVLQGTQRIGWDGSLEKFRSWVFDSEGGYADGIWTDNDDHWTVSATGVRPGGEACSATQTYEPDGPDAYLFSVTDRIVDGEELPDFTAHVVRTPPKPEGAGKLDSATPPK